MITIIFGVLVCSNHTPLSATTFFIVRLLLFNTFNLTSSSYVVHSSFWILFPLHFAYLVATTNYSASELWRSLTTAISSHPSLHEPSTRPSNFPWLRFFSLTLGLTVGVTVPALLWFAAISLASYVVSQILSKT